MLSNMKARLMLDERRVVAENAFVELVVWQLPATLPGCTHRFKYRLALVVNGQCVVRYDNETGKGDHRHVGKREMSYRFTTIKSLLTDFWNEVDHWRL
ncbi:MAG: toxin-antitoxin system TumE family protein [Acidiferrobacteraceae bacterium]